MISVKDFLRIREGAAHHTVGAHIAIPKGKTMLDGSFLSEEQVRALRDQFGSPFYVYSEEFLLSQAEKVLSMPSAFGLTPRYAMKACPNLSIVKLLHSAGLKIDASSGFEAMRCLAIGIPGEDIQLTSQEMPVNISELVAAGIQFNACSLNQLAMFGELFPNTAVSVRFNPGLGSGFSNRTNVGGPSSSFGIWHQYAGQVKEIAAKYNLTVNAIHSHIGAGTDPDVWVRCADLTLAIAAEFPDVATINMGGGFKAARMPGEVSADLTVIGNAVKDKFIAFREKDPKNRELKMQIEPGTFLTAGAGAVIATIIDIKNTGSEGYNFLLVDTGMTEILRPSIYGAQHPIYLVTREQRDAPGKEYLIAGHCCESGDILTPAPGDPEGLLPRSLKEAEIGDVIVVGGAGAYCSGMTTTNYNSFPKAAEVLLTKDVSATVIRRRETPEEVYQLER